MPFFGVPIRNGLPIGLGSVAGFGVQQFDPLELFAGGANGVWYDPSDTSTLFQDPAGTTPVTAVEQPVGLMLDKSKGLVLGPELVTNGTQWTAVAPTASLWTPSTSTLRVTGGISGGTYYNYLATAGTIYKATFSVSVVSAGTWYVIAKAAANAGSSNLYVASGTTSTTVTFYFTNITATPSIYIQITNGGVIDVTNISVRELPGNHAISYNPNNARPQLSARVNLLVATATLSTQSVTTQATSYTLSFAGAGSITLSGTATGSYNAGTHTITCTAGTLTLTVSGAVTTADLRPANSGALLPAYQAVVDANTYDTNGFPKYLYFAGTDDGMSTPANLNLTSTDKVTVFSGVRKLSDAATGLATELSAILDTTNGTFNLIVPSLIGANSYRFSSKGTTVAGAGLGVFAAAPDTSVLTGIGDISGDIATLRRNGSVVETVTTDQGTGNYGSYPLFIGARNNASLWFNGYLYGLTVVGAQLTTPQIESMETWTAQRTGITL